MIATYSLLKAYKHDFGYWISGSLLSCKDFHLRLADSIYRTRAFSRTPCLQNQTKLAQIAYNAMVG